jgi:hypothetical protein
MQDAGPVADALRAEERPVALASLGVRAAERMAVT